MYIKAKKALWLIFRGSSHSEAEKSGKRMQLINLKTLSRTTGKDVEM